MKIVKISEAKGIVDNVVKDFWKYTPMEYKDGDQIDIEVGNKVKCLQRGVQWIIGKWLQGFLISSFRSDIQHPSSGNYTGFDDIFSVKKEGTEEWLSVKRDSETEKYVVTSPFTPSEEPSLALTGGNKMKIIKKSQNSVQNFVRFDQNARVEIFVNEWDIRADDQYDNIILQKDITDEQKINMLKEVVMKIARERMAALDDSIESSGIDVTIDGLSWNLVNIDRIRWGKLVHPEEE